MASTTNTALTRIDTALRPGYYACARGHKARYLGPSDPDAGGVMFPRVAGRRIGYVVETCDKGGCSGHAELVELATGKKVRSPEQHLMDMDFTEAAVSSYGIAWIVSGQAGGQVGALSAAGHTSAVDSGPIDVGSLAIAGKRVYWTKAAAPASTLI